jgi:thymidylate synthase (FAD)
MWVDDGVTFFEDSRVYLVGYSKFHGNGFHLFMKDFGMTLKEGQMTGTDGENIIEAGARACYLSYGVGRDSQEHIENIVDSDHGSVTRHAVANVMITGVSRGFTHELVRHAAGCDPSQSSSRFIPARKLGFVVPPEYRQRPLLRSDFIGHAKRSLELYEDHVEVLKLALKDEMPNSSTFSRTKVARGAARGILPINLNQVIQFSMNAQAFRHVLRMRGNEFADAEIREVACKLAPIAKQLWPVLMQDVEVKDGAVSLRSEV